MFAFKDAFFLFLSLGVSLALIVPLTGVLIRFRANYNPKGLQLDAEGAVQPHTGPVVSTYAGMMIRVYRIEGVAGMYKGLMPTFISTLVVTIFVVIVLNAPKHHGAYKTPNTGPLGTLAYSLLMMLMSLPTAIVTYRAITTPHRLPYFKPMVSLRILLTPTERRRPWILYLTSGLLAAEVAHIAYVVLFLGALRRILLPALSQPGIPSADDLPTFPLAIYFTIAMLSTVILTPLEVISTRLAIQRNHAAAGFNSVSQEEEGDDEGVAEFAGADEDVIGLRSEEDPYLGLIDCAKRIVDEEGWRALYRAWWLTMLGAMAGAFS